MTQMGRDFRKQAEEIFELENIGLQTIQAGLNQMVFNAWPIWVEAQGTRLLLRRTLVHPGADVRDDLTDPFNPADWSEVVGGGIPSDEAPNGRNTGVAWLNWWGVNGLLITEAEAFLVLRDSTAASLPLNAWTNPLSGGLFTQGEGQQIPNYPLKYEDRLYSDIRMRDVSSAATSSAWLFDITYLPRGVPPR